MSLLSWFFVATTFIGIVLTIFYGRKSAKLEIERKKIDWADMQSCANDLGPEIRKAFRPDVILTPGLRGATFSNLLVEEFDWDIPVFVGVESWKEKTGSGSSYKSFMQIETSKWLVHIPECLLNFKEQKLLIVDDFCMSGDSLEQLKTLLVSHGFVKNNVRAVCMVTTKVAQHSHKGPDYFWIQNTDDNFYFPWGKAK